MCIFDPRVWFVTCLLWAALLYPIYGQDRPSPQTQALSSKLISEIDGGIQCSARVIELSEQLKAAQAELEKLKAAASKE